MHKREKNITIKDVAKAAEVSITTVSRVLNDNHNAVNADTRERIKQVIDELGYVPNAMARGLHGSKTKIIGLFVQDIGNPYYPSIVRGVEQTAQRLGYSIILANVQRSQSKTGQYLDVMREKRVDGLILVGGIARDMSENFDLEKSGMKSVVIGSYLREGIASIWYDNVSAARMACEFLIGRGHRRIATVTGLSNSKTAQDREQGYREALEAAGIKPKKRWIIRGNFKFDGGFAAVSKLLSGETPDITAVLAHNDLMAIGVINALVKRGYRVPEDISVIGFDNIQLASYYMPALTTVNVPFDDLGKKAMESLAKLLAGKKVQQSIILPTSIEIRESVGAPKARQ